MTRSTVGTNDSRSKDDPFVLIPEVAKAYGVPAGLLYGVWKKESGGIPRGFSENWPLAADLVKKNGQCVKRYGAAVCAKHWDAIVSLCGQNKPDGRKVCDPKTVRTSHALAMGPMQIMPGEIVSVGKNGTSAWTGNKVDYDGDGTVDLLSMADSLAIAAKELRAYHDQHASDMGDNQAWIWAANRYYGSQSAGYFEGTSRGDHGVQYHWDRWCRMPGYCVSDARVAMNR